MRLLAVVIAFAMAATTCGCSSPEQESHALPRDVVGSPIPSPVHVEEGLREVTVPPPSSDGGLVHDVVPVDGGEAGTPLGSSDAQGLDAGPALCSPSNPDGECAAGKVCGDNNKLGQCGSFCMAGGWENLCSQVPGTPAGGAWQNGCQKPYWLISGEPVYRDGGLEGCVYRSIQGMALQCCP